MSLAEVTTKYGSEIVWEDPDGTVHIANGAQLVPVDADTFCLWTLCGSQDIPANTAYKGSHSDATCEKCSQKWSDDNGQFGVGA